MVLFLITELPVLFVMVAFLPWKSGQVPRTLSLMSTFLKGVLVFLPSYLVILLARGVFGFSYEGFLLYLSLLQRDHLVPVLAALAGFLLVQKKLSFSGAEEGIFLTVFSFMAGFFTLMNLTDALRTWGGWDAYVLFLLPLLRLGTVVLLSLLAQRFFRWEGSEGGLFIAAGAALAFLLGLPSFFYRINRVGWSVLLAMLALLGSVWLFAMRFPRALRG